MSSFQSAGPQSRPSPFSPSPRTLTALGWPHLLGALAGLTRTTLGRQGALSLPFLDDAAAIAASWTRLTELRSLLRDQLRLPIGELDDLRPVFARAAKEAVLAATELLGCASVIRTGSDLRRFLASQATRAPALSGQSRALAALDGLAARIESAIGANGEIKDEAS